MNKETLVFKPEEVKLELEGKEYRLVYDLNAFCELEKMYDSVDSILQMLLGAADNTVMPPVIYKGVEINPDEVNIADVTLTAYILQSAAPERQAKHTDTLNLLWAGLLHDHAIYDEYDEIKGYSISKSRVGSLVTFKNLREINSMIVLALLRDLMPQVEGEEQKNEQAPEKQLTLVSKD